MEPVSLILTLFSHLPIVDLFAHGPPTTAGGWVYDVGQALIGLNALALLLNKIAKVTPWTWDDGIAAGFLGVTARGLSLMTRFMATYNPQDKAAQAALKQAQEGVVGS